MGSFRAYCLARYACASFALLQCLRVKVSLQQQMALQPRHMFVGECAQIAERVKKAVGKAAEGKPLQGQGAAILGNQAAPAKAPGYEGDAEMQ